MLIYSALRAPLLSPRPGLLPRGVAWRGVAQRGVDPSGAFGSLMYRALMDRAPAAPSGPAALRVATRFTTPRHATPRPAVTPSQRLSPYLTFSFHLQGEIIVPEHGLLASPPTPRLTRSIGHFGR